MLRIYLIFALVVLGACFAGPAAEAEITGDWRLVAGTVDGRAIPLRAPVTLRISETEASGSAGCNQYGALFSLDGSVLTFGDIYSTLMMCVPEVMDTEIPYLAALGRVDTASIGDELVLSGPGVELKFGPA